MLVQRGWNPVTGSPPIKDVSTKGGGILSQGFEMSCVCSHSNDDLNRHGDTRQLADDVGQRPRWRCESKQVGEGVHDTGQEKDQEMTSCHRQGGTNHGVDSAQEEEGVDVFHVIAMCSENEKKTQEKRKEISQVKTMSGTLQEGHPRHQR